MSNHTGILLSKGSWKALISPSQGMNTYSLTYKNMPLLRTPTSSTVLHQNPHIYGNPLLFPPNRTDAGQFCFDGTIYHLPINESSTNNHLHGFLAETLFTILQQTNTSVIAQFSNKDELFPFPFQLDVEYFLDDFGYHQKFIFTNIGTTAMPLTFGLHTNFFKQQFLKLPLKQRLERDERYLPTGNFLTLTAEEAALTDGLFASPINVGGYYTIHSNSMQIGDIRYNISSQFDHLVIWKNELHPEFIAIEPHCGAPNALNAKSIRRLEPNQSEHFSVDFLKMNNG
ncbi:aldose 1-epimerase [Chakrabartyella piscis]|uniref:aldose 1-epimerase n=1 Tax=Chakrabartyella piscis TaxID=2918914 RepID=UPI0029585F34|nr:aldose 1-epimerase [Chakrabartyella piscis]